MSITLDFIIWNNQSESIKPKIETTSLYLQGIVEVGGKRGRVEGQLPLKVREIALTKHFIKAPDSEKFNFDGCFHNLPTLNPHPTIKKEKEASSIAKHKKLGKTSCHLPPY